MLHPPNYHPRKKVAIVGAGSSGIAALWALNRTHHDVYLYEAVDRLGGHTNTVDWRNGKYTTKVDTGFMVFNTVTHANFINFLAKLKVSTVPTPTSFAVTRDHIFEWASSSLGSLFSQRRNIFSPRMWRMVFDIIRFNLFSIDLLTNQDLTPRSRETIGEYLQREGYSDAFRNDYFVPIIASAWGPSLESMLDLPAAMFIRLLWDNHLLSTVTTRPNWLAIPTGSKSYIDAVLRGFPPSRLFPNTPVRSVTDEPHGRIRLHLANGTSNVFDHVILATHGDQAYDIIRESATRQEREILALFHTSNNTAVLHSDPALMPATRKVWSSRNYLTATAPGDGRRIDQVSLTYNMNLLQQIPREIFGDVFVTVNPLHEPRPETVQGRFTYSRPLYDTAAIEAQKRLESIQNRRGISYAGSWTEAGFHDIGFTSGLRVAKEHLGAMLPFELVDLTQGTSEKPRLGLVDLLLRVLILLVQILVFDMVDGVLELVRMGEGRRVISSVKIDGLPKRSPLRKRVKCM